MFWAGVFCGVCATYVVSKIVKAVNEQRRERLYRCSIEAAKISGNKLLDFFTDEELIRAIAKGLDPESLRNDRVRQVHQKLRDEQKSIKSDR